MRSERKHALAANLLAAAIGLCVAGAPALGQDKEKKKPDFPEFSKISEGYEKVVSTADGQSYYNVWTRKKDGQILAELPRGFESQKFFIATTIGSGDIFAGLQGGMRYVTWKRYDKRLALIEPRTDIKATGDQESKDSVSRIWTDRVLLDVPIVAMGPGGNPVIDMDAFMLGKASTFFGRSAGGANAKLATIKKAKAFPMNIELAIEVPVSGGTLRTFHYSISKVQTTKGFKPRPADDRIGYFTVGHRDLGKFHDDDVPVTYITRWPLTKRDPNLKMSPPQEPLIYYIEHTVPVRYRRYVKQGLLYWNKAFEQVGLLDAIEVRYQDKASGAHMEKDPEDVRYNFIRWLNNDIGTAIGPSRPHPDTGEILDADIVLTDGWIRHFWYQYTDYLPQVMMEGFNAETIAWFDTHPNWDPRIRLASAQDRPRLLYERAQRIAEGYSNPSAIDPMLINDEIASDLADQVGNSTLLCMAANGKARDMALMGMHLEMLGILDDDDDEDGEEYDGDILDGIPEWFIGPMLADLVAHEVGHTLGLRHNFKASTVYTLEEMNSEEFKGNKTITGSVMDYTPANINMDDGEIQGDYAMIDIGPYDMWAIEYGYTSGDTKEILKRVSEPELIYGTDEDTGGSDPRGRRYDFAKNPLNYANSRMRLVEQHRGQIIEKFVKEGQGWHKARRGYRITLSTQANAMSIMSRWLGGTYTNRDHKGDPGDRKPVTPIDAETQRAALNFIIDNSFNDEAFGLTTELLSYMTVDKKTGYNRDEEAYDVHDSILGIQASAISMLMNPTTLRRVYDNEYRTPEDQDQLTLPELLETISNAAWSEIDDRPDKRYNAREPMISSLRRNLQREHLERIIDLTKPDAGFTAAYKPISNLAMMQLRGLKDRIDATLEHGDSKLDAYTNGHLTEASIRIAKVLDADYIYNANDMGGSGGGMPFFFFKPTENDN